MEYCGLARLSLLKRRNGEGTEKVWLKPLREELRCGTLRFYFAFIKSLILSLSVAYSGEAGHGPLASAPRKCRNAVGGLGKTLEGKKKKKPF